MSQSGRTGQDFLRPVRFLVPGTTGRFRCGGLLVELQTARLVAQIAPVQVVTYRQREPDKPFLADLLQSEPLQCHGLAEAAKAPLWVVSWGFDVPHLLRRLRGRLTAYHAHSSGYGFDLPPGVPVLAVSRNTLGYWGSRAPRNPLFLLPNALDAQWLERGDRSNPAGGVEKRRRIDVLVQRRKSSDYVLNQLVPALRERGLTVEIQDGWIDDLVGLFNSSTVYLYDSADYWRGRGVSEGFGLPPIEALACGCIVFSSLNHALADLLDPGELGHQIGCGSLEADVERICGAVVQPSAWRPQPLQLQGLLHTCSEPVLLERWRWVLDQITWQHSLQQEGAEPLVSPASLALRWSQRWSRCAAAGRSVVRLAQRTLIGRFRDIP